MSSVLASQAGCTPAGVRLSIPMPEGRGLSPHFGNRGRYALDDTEHSTDITSGQALAILLDSRWIEGSIEHAGGLYALEQASQPVSSGYYFLASDGNVCGLCVGMKVRGR